MPKPKWEEDWEKFGKYNPISFIRTQLEGVINSIPPQYPIQLKASLRAEWLGESKELTQPPKA